MKDRVLIVCASRDRPEQLAHMLDSVCQTSTHADTAIYVDEEQRDLYGSNPRFTYGGRMGPVRSLNELVRLHPGYAAYCAATDDCVFTTAGWAEWVLEAAEGFPGGVGAMTPVSTGSASRNHPPRMDFPCVTGRWIEALGWFAWHGCGHFYWDILIELLAEATALKEASAEEFSIRHDAIPTPDVNVKSVTDARNLLPVIGLERRGMIAKLKAAAAQGLGPAVESWSWYL